MWRVVEKCKRIYQSEIKLMKFWVLFAVLVAMNLHKHIDKRIWHVVTLIYIFDTESEILLFQIV